MRGLHQTTWRAVTPDRDPGLPYPPRPPGRWPGRLLPTLAPAAQPAGSPTRSSARIKPATATRGPCVVRPVSRAHAPSGRPVHDSSAIPHPNEYHRVRILALHQLIGHYWAVDCHPQQLFGSAVAYYAQYRPGYPRDLVDALAARAGLDGTQRVLDIGCGTGQITIPLARHAQAVMAIDPIPGMLAGWGYGGAVPRPGLQPAAPRRQLARAVGDLRQEHSSPDTSQAPGRRTPRAHPRRCRVQPQRAIREVRAW